MTNQLEDGLLAAQNGDFKRAHDLLLPEAEKGDAVAQYNLGMMYARGDGVARNPSEAVRWWRKAAEKKFAPAQNNIGFAYQTGEGAELNLTEAVKWYRLAAEKGDPMAQANLGAAYAEGRGVEQNWELSTKWYRLSAEQGFPLGMANLGINYLYGHGVKQDFVQAYKWLVLGRHFTPESDVEGRSKLTEHFYKLCDCMTREQMEEATELGRKWQPPTQQVDDYRRIKT